MIAACAQCLDTNTSSQCIYVLSRTVIFAPSAKDMEDPEMEPLSIIRKLFGSLSSLTLLNLIHSTRYCAISALRASGAKSSL